MESQSQQASFLIFIWPVYLLLEKGKMYETRNNKKGSLRNNKKGSFKDNMITVIFFFWDR